MALAQARLHARTVEGVPIRAIAHLLWALRAAVHSGMEGWEMNEFGEPNIGNPPVRFDYGREILWSLAGRVLNPASPAYSTTDLVLLTLTNQNTVNSFIIRSTSFTKYSHLMWLK